RDVEKFAGLSFRAGVSGSPVLNDVPGWLECKVEASLDSGDRTCFLAQVIDGNLISAGPVLTVQQLLRLAPPAKLQLMRGQRAADAGGDAPLIERWRAGRGG